MSLAEPSPHPRAVEARVRKTSHHIYWLRKEAWELAPSFANALIYVASVPTGLCCLGAIFADPAGIVAKSPVKIQTARAMYRKAMVRFESDVECKHWLKLTRHGEELASVLMGQL